MEVEEIQAQACKFPRIGNGRNGSGKIGPDEDEDGEVRRRVGGENQLMGWQNSSRIIRVSRASGGKDRHSKVWTSKGLRDRRVRLSVTTAIQFYDLQDRLGYDQPSKAVEWLIKAAEEAISELPALNSSFPETPRHLSDVKRNKGFDSAEIELENYHQTPNSHNQNQVSLSKSSSTSETSKGSGLSLSQSDVRVNRTKTSRDRAAKDKEKDQHQNMNPISHNSSSFTELLTGGSNSTGSPTGEANLYHKAPRQWSAAAPMDYFSSGLLGPSSSSRMQAFHLGNSTQVSPYNVAGDGHLELQQFSFVPDHFIPVVSQQQGSGSSDYNLNFTISSSAGPGLASGYNSRGTLQSNSQSFFPHLQRFASPIDGSSVPFLLGSATPVENHHHQHLQQQQHIFYGDSGRLHSDHKEKEKD